MAQRPSSASAKARGRRTPPRDAAPEPEPEVGDQGAPPLPPGLDVLWGRRQAGRRGPRPAFSVEEIVQAAMRVADADGLEAVTMARVAEEIGFTTMSLYRYVNTKEELLQLMWNASAIGAETLVLEGSDWRSRIRNWALIQRDVIDQHPWITEMPMAAPPLGPNSLAFVEQGLEALDGAGLDDQERLRVIGLLSSYTLSEARMAHDADRAARAAGAEAGPWPSFESILRLLVNEDDYPNLHRIAWNPQPARPVGEREEFAYGVERILDGIEHQIEHRPGTARRRSGGRASPVR